MNKKESVSYTEIEREIMGIINKWEKDKDSSYGEREQLAISIVVQRILWRLKNLYD